MAGSDQGVFAISVAAEMVSMEIQNLRVYERHGLLTPARTSGGTRLYSADDVERLGRIRELLAQGLNLVGIAHVLDPGGRGGRASSAARRAGVTHGLSRVVAVRPTTDPGVPLIFITAKSPSVPSTRSSGPSFSRDVHRGHPW